MSIGFAPPARSAEPSAEAHAWRPAGVCVMHTSTEVPAAVGSATTVDVPRRFGSFKPS